MATLQHHRSYLKRRKYSNLMLNMYQPHLLPEKRNQTENLVKARRRRKKKKKRHKKQQHRHSIWFPSCFCKDKPLPGENHKIVVVVQLFQKKAQEFLTDKPFQQWHKSSFVLHSLHYLHGQGFQKFSEITQIRDEIRLKELQEYAINKIVTLRIKEAQAKELFLGKKKLFP